MIRQFCDWLAATALSQSIQGASWAIPVIQTIHILCIAVTLSSMAMLALRLLGLAGKRQTQREVATSMLPWMWRALIVLLATGLLLIIAEPGRSLPNPLFQIKMALLVCVLALSHVIGRAGQVATGATARRAAGDIALARPLGLLTLIAWTGIVVAGRWIAYV